MLIDKDEWESIIEVGEPIIKKKYIFYYCFSITEKIQRLLHFLSRKYKMPVYFLEAKEWALKTCWRNAIRLVGKYGPDVYMNMVKNSTLFLTTSFHGTAFATIYKKCFWYIDTGNNNPEKDDRALTFLNQLGLMERYKSIDNLKQLDIYQKFDYEESICKLDKLRIISFDYLNRIVEEIKNE